MIKTSNYIPEEIIHQIAEKVYLETAKCYQKEEGFDCVRPASLDQAPRHVQKNVVRDVKFVLLGNRDAEYLHESWRQRKLEAKCGKNATWDKATYRDFFEDNCSTAWYPWSNLDIGQRQGYIFFVERVKGIYSKLTSNPLRSTVEEEIVGSRSFNLVLTTARHTHTSYYERRGKWTVQLHFQNKEDAEAFKNAVSDVK